MTKSIYDIRAAYHADLMGYDTAVAMLIKHHGYDAAGADGFLVGRKPPPLSTPPCPCCGARLRDEPAENAVSRYYQGIYICSQCGVREAFEGQFWRPRSSHTAFVQHHWIKAHRGEDE